MSKQLYEEAIADLKKVKEIAEDNAKRAVVEAVAPRIRELIEKELLSESFGVSESDEDEKVEKAADEPESKEEEAKETPEDEKKEEVKKSFSVWQGAFSPDIKRGM